MLLDPTTARPDIAVPAAPAPDTHPVPASREPDDGPRPLPDDLRRLLARARRDRGAALALVHVLLERGWSVPAVGAILDGRVGLSRRQVEALGSVRRPRTSATDVADRLVAARLVAARTGAPHGPHVPVPAPRGG